MKKRTVIATAAAATLLGGVGLLGMMTANGQQTVARPCTPGTVGCDQALTLPAGAGASPFDGQTNVVPPGGATHPQCTVAIPTTGQGSGLQNRNGGIDVSTTAIQSLCPPV